MDLETFIKDTLIQILNGAMAAQERGVDILSSNAREVEFDVAVTVNEETRKEGKAGIFVWATGIGGQTGAASANSMVSRLKFSVPIFYPEQKRK